MKTFTKTEITWMINTMESTRDHMKVLSELEAATNAEKALYLLRAEQLDVIAAKLHEAVDHNDKRIAIVY